MMMLLYCSDSVYILLLFSIHYIIILQHILILYCSYFVILTPYCCYYTAIFSCNGLGLRLQLVYRSPYSPDLNLCDRFMFTRLKKDVRPVQYDNKDEVVKAA